MWQPKATKGEVEAGAAAAKIEEAVAVGAKAATAKASAAESSRGAEADEGPTMADMAKYKQLQLKEKAGLKAKLQTIKSELQHLKAQAADQAAKQVQKRKEREQRAQQKKRLQREDVAGEMAKKSTLPPKPPPKSTYHLCRARA
mmetsp:Transcript_9440/g.22264  ORF Transcript_9440/g.22264 Transcript_9440/m.22264 type:complete len:144 (-) Transcript_9440:34-465(-)